MREAASATAVPPRTTRRVDISKLYLQSTARVDVIMLVKESITGQTKICLYTASRIALLGESVLLYFTKAKAVLPLASPMISR